MENGDNNNCKKQGFLQRNIEKNSVQLLVLLCFLTSMWVRMETNQGYIQKAVDAQALIDERQGERINRIELEGSYGMRQRMGTVEATLSELKNNQKLLTDNQSRLSELLARMDARWERDKLK